MDISKVKILHISKYYYPFLGGIEQVARDMVKIFVEHGVEQKVLCFNEDAIDEKIICKHNENVTDVIDGIEVIRCGYILKFASQSLSISFGRKLNELMNDFKPNVVIFHYPNPFATHFLLKYKNRKFKLLVYWHLDITKQKFLKHLFYFQNLMLIRRATKILGATPKHVDESAFSSWFGEKKYILPYMIDEKKLEPTNEDIDYAKKIREIHSGRILAVFVGRHVPYKGLSYLIKASKELVNLNIQFLIAGDGPLTKLLKKEAQNDTKIKFIGRITDSEKRAYMYASDIICFPSITRNEGFGLALAEGMYFGKPAVTFTIQGSGVNYVNLNGVTGIECPNRDYVMYANALKILCQNKELREKLGKAARQRVLENFTSDTFQKNIINLLNEL